MRDQDAALRPERLVVIAGTGTDVGKTWVGAQGARHMRAQGVQVAVRKLAQSFDPDDGRPTDVEELAAATGETPEQVCPQPRWYPVPMAPPMAAEALGRPSPSLAELLRELTWPAGAEVGMLEQAGGLAAPQAADADGVEAVRVVGPDLVTLVADAGLGVLNLVRLSVRALGEVRVVVFLNRYDPLSDLHQRNRSWLAERDGLHVVTGVDGLAAAILGARGEQGQSPSS
jgi:dethiobiotin synthetase